MYHVPIVRSQFMHVCYDPVTMFYVTAAAVTVTTATQATAAHDQRKAQKSMLADRAAQIAGAEKKAALAETQAAEAASKKLKKFRLAQTRSILTSPLGVQDEAVTGRSTLLGG